MDVKNLQDGIYSIDVNMMNASQPNKKSMSDGAVEKDKTRLIVENGQYKVRLTFKPITITHIKGWLGKLSYQDGNGEFTPSTVLSRYSKNITNEKDYPRVLEYPIDKTKIQDNKLQTTVQVFVSAMESIKQGMGTQFAKPTFDFSKIKVIDKSSDALTKDLLELKENFKKEVNGLSNITKEEVDSLASEVTSINSRENLAKLVTKAYKLDNISEFIADNAPDLKKEQKEKYKKDYIDAQTEEKEQEVINNIKASEEKNSKDIETVKSVAKEKIQSLQNLEQKEREDYISKITAETEISKIHEIEKEAIQKDRENKASAKENLQQEREKALGELEKLTNLTQGQKESLKAKITNAGESSELEKITQEAKALDEKNKDPQTKKLVELKEQGIKIIKEQTHLTEEEQTKYIERINSANSEEAINKVYIEATDLNEKRMSLDEYKEFKIKEIKEYDKNNKTYSLSEKQIEYWIGKVKEKDNRNDVGNMELDARRSGQGHLSSMDTIKNFKYLSEERKGYYYNLIDNVFDVSSGDEYSKIIKEARAENEKGKISDYKADYKNLRDGIYSIDVSVQDKDTDFVYNGKLSPVDPMFDKDKTRLIVKDGQYKVVLNPIVFKHPRGGLFFHIWHIQYFDNSGVKKDAEITSWYDKNLSGYRFGEKGSDSNAYLDVFPDRKAYPKTIEYPVDKSKIDSKNELLTNSKIYSFMLNIFGHDHSDTAELVLRFATLRPIELDYSKEKATAKEQIKSLNFLEDKEQKDFNSEIDKAKDDKEINNILEQAKAKNTANKELKDAKTTALAELDKLANLTKEQKKAAKEEIDKAKNIAEVNEAKAKAKEKDTEAITNAKNAAKAEIDKLANLTKEQKKAAKEEIDKAKNIAEVNEAKAEAKEKDTEALTNAKTAALAELDKLANLDAKEKDSFKELINKATEKAKVVEVLDQAKAKNTANKELKEAKTKAIAELDKLDQLTNEEKDSFKEQINKATEKTKVSEALDQAKAKDTANKELKEAKEKAVKEVTELKNLTEAEKTKAALEINKANSVAEVNTALAKAKELDKKHGAENPSVTPTPTPEVKAGWQNDEIGWWYLRANGSFAKAEWEPVNGTWYHFDENGYMQTGWLNLDGTWYYLNADGSMACDTWIGTYYVDASGSWVIEGWQQNGYGWWYQRANGTYPHSEWEIINGTWYHFDESGYMQTGWLNLDGTWYYLNADGSMATDTYVDGYYVDENGAWVK